MAAWLIPAFGWRAVFYFGGAIPLVIAALMFLWLPESLQFLVAAAKATDRACARWLKRIDPDGAGVTATTEFVVQEENRGGVPAMHLFREGRALGTVLLWVINFMNIFNLYVLSGWLPTVADAAGISDADRRARRHDAAGRRDARHVLADVVHQQVGIHPGADDLFHRGVGSASR